MFGEHMQDLLQQTTEPEPEEPPRELTVEEALEIAIQLQRDDRLEEAERRLRRDSQGRSGESPRAALRRRAGASDRAQRATGSR